MAIPPSISLGVEVEFLTAQFRDDRQPDDDLHSRWACGPPSESPYETASPEGPHYWAEMSSVLESCKAIADTGLPTACPYPSEPDALSPIIKDAKCASANPVLKCSNGTSIRTWNNNAVQSSARAGSQAGYWFMTRERHISVDVRRIPGKSPSTKYHWHGTELNSPVLILPIEFDNKLPSLKRCLNAIQNNMKIALNESCGLHLHVNDNGKLNLDTAKRVACLVLLLEDPLFYQISHPSRGRSPFSVRISKDSKAVLEKGAIPKLKGDGAFQITALSALADKLEGRWKVNKKIIEAMKRIYAQPDRESLRNILKKFNEGPVHTTRRCGLVVSCNDTIEFRYPASTFDTDYIAAWGQLVRHIYGLAMKPANEFSHIICHVYDVVTRGGTAAWDKPARWEDAMEAIEFRDVGHSEWSRWIEEFNGKLKDLDKQGPMPRMPRMLID
ncbi:hypothetical protein EDB81DRAFT_925208 [Dactylonectria macrodidyma]|uniref:Amidoligase enzyme-domain-containing protein n=1 Tax=Dactylonectria macrodidyma TaxID=307937 RepID=A0A9P9FG36_9HYPO|nr:hypothetical protein EDB81DRAFT_925208 [Dactylonectria macrodidyma]